jgi:hypothetical protein
MSTWFFMKENGRNPTEIFYEIGDILVKKRTSTTLDKIKLPQIKATFKIDENIIKDENEKKANAIHQTLMGNWKNKLFESNSLIEKK